MRVTNDMVEKAVGAHFQAQSGIRLRSDNNSMRYALVAVLTDLPEPSLHADKEGER